MNRFSSLLCARTVLLAHAAMWSSTLRNINRFAFQRTYSHEVLLLERKTKRCEMKTESYVTIVSMYIGKKSFAKTSINSDIYIAHTWKKSHRGKCSWFRSGSSSVYMYFVRWEDEIIKLFTSSLSSSALNGRAGFWNRTLNWIEVIWIYTWNETEFDICRSDPDIQGKTLTH